MTHVSAPSVRLLTLLTVFLAPSLLAPPAAAQSYPGIRCGATVHEGDLQGFVPFPEGSIFCPLVADPKAEHSFMTLLKGDFPTLTEREYNTEVGSVGLGDAFPFFRRGDLVGGTSMQFGISGGVFAQFDLRAASFDLINADYVVGLPLTVRRGPLSLRVRLYHQSSHLGDEFLLREDPLERENLSFESLEVIISREWNLVRVYGGGEHLFRREPEALEARLMHGGVELRTGPERGPRLIVGLDVKFTEEQGWGEPAVSLRGGVELAFWRDHGHPPRTLAVLGEYYSGPSPYGQFFQNDLRFIGVGLHFFP